MDQKVAALDARLESRMNETYQITGTRLWEITKFGDDNPVAPNKNVEGH